MTLEIGLLLAILGVAVVLFSIDRLPADISSTAILLALVLFGLLAPEEAFAGFGSETVVMIFGLLVLTAALMRTGVVDMAGRAFLKFTGDHPNRLLAVIMISAAVLSAFISNTATTALLLPITLGLAHHTRRSPSKLLMPLAFASILASSVTLVSSSTNIVISGLMQLYGLPPLGMFELALVGIPVMVIGVIYMLLIGHRMIPDRSEPEELEQGYGIRPYLAEVLVLPESSVVGKTLQESGLGRDLDLTILRVVRDKNRYLIPQAGLILETGDQLLVKGQRHQILKIKDTAGLGFKCDVQISDPRLQTEEMQLAEAILLPGSELIGRTLKTLNFRQRYGLQILGVNRRGENIFRKLSQTRLRVGDQLLVEGTRTDIHRMDESGILHIIGEVAHTSPNRRRAPIAIAIFGGSLLLAGTNVLPLAVAVLLGTLLAFVTRCITPDEAYHEVAWKAIIVIGGMLALGQAMENTGAAAFLAAQITHLTVNANPLWLLTGFFALTMAFTQPMSNQAAAVVVLPIALQTAMQLGLNPRTFAVMIAVGASCSFITPLEPACLMIYGPGRYKFVDFIKVGSILTVIIYLIAILLVPLFWPLR